MKLKDFAAKIKSVIRSCKTREQLDIAVKWASRTVNKKFRDVGTIFPLLRFESMVNISKEYREMKVYVEKREKLKCENT